MHGLQPCGALVACGRRLFLQAISPPFLVVSSSTKKHDVGRVFLICAKFVCTNLCDLFQKSHVEPVVCARRPRILRALIAFSCRQQLIKYRLFTTKTSCFFNAFLTHLHDLFLNRAWSLSSALDAFSCKQSLIFACRQQLYGLFCHRCLSAAILFVLVFST